MTEEAKEEEEEGWQKWAHKGFPGGTRGREPTCQCRRHKRPGFSPSVRGTPGGGHGKPLQDSCLENPMDREPGRLQSMGSQRVTHDWSDLACSTARGNVRGRKMTGNEWDYKERFFSILLRLWPSEAWSYSFPFHPAYCPLAIKNLTLVLMLI